MAGGASTSIVINIDTKQATNNIDNLEQRFAKLQETVSKLGAEQYLTNEYNELIKMSEILKKSAETAKTTFDKITLFTDMRSFLSSVENFNKKIDETGAKVDKISNISFKVDNIEFTSKSVIENQLKKLQDICDKESKKIKLNIGVENFAKTNVKNIVKEYKKNLETEIKKNIESGDFRATVPLMYKYKVISQGYNTNNMNFNDIDTKREAAISKLTSPDLKRFGLTEEQTNQIKSEWNKNSQDLLATIENISNELTTKAQNIKITSGKNGINIVDNKSLNDTETQINELKQTISKAYDELLDVFDVKNKEARTKTYDLSKLIVEKLNQLKVLDPKAINLENITEAYNRQINTEAILKKANVMISEPDLLEYEDTEDKIGQYNDLLGLLKDLKTAKGALSDKSFSKILSDNNINVTDINNKFKTLHEGFVQTNVDFNKLSGSATEFQTLIGEVFGNKYILPEFKGTGTGSGSGSGSGTGNGSGDSDFDNAEVEKLQQDYADLTAEVEKYKAQITETTAKLEEMKKTQAESDGDKSKIKELQASLDALNVSYAEAQNKMKEYRSELATYESMSLVQDANGNNVNQEQYDKLISDAKQTATELENTRNQLKMLQEQAAAGGSDEYVVQLNNQLKSTEAMLNKVTNELEYMESSRNRWMDRAEMNAVTDESGQSVYQNDYDNIVAKLSEMKTEAQNAKDELEKLKATSVQLGEGEQVAKTSDIEAVKGLSEAVKNLQERMTKAEEILQEVPKGMDGLKKLSSQIQKMSGNFNEDGSIKNLGISAEALSEQLKNLDAEFDARIAKKIEEIEKKSYKENQPKKKFKLAESVKSLKVVAAQTAPKVEVQQVNNDIKSAQQDATVKAEEITKELYKETEQYKTLSKAVQEYNALTSQKLDATAYDARIERMQKMQALVASIIETVEKYEGKASELSALTLKSKNGNIGIQDTVKLDELMSKLKAGEAKNISKKEQTEQLKQDAQKYVDVVRDYNNKFQSIISQKVSSGKQFNSVKQQLNDLSNSIDAIMDKYDQFKGQDFYSAEFASYGEKLRGTVKDSSLDLNEITKFKGYEQEILSIQLKYSESLQKQKKEQDAVAEAARKKAEAEKEAIKAAEEAENKMSVAEKSREEQKRKALERQAAQSGTQNIVSSDNSADTSPADNTTLSAILTEVKSINGKMGGTQSVDVNVGNSPNLKVDGAVSEIKAQSDAMEQAAEKEVAAIQRVANEGKKQFREADMYYYESAKKNANNIDKATIGLSLENGGDRTDEMYRIVNETNKDFFANLRTMYDSAYESVKKIDDVIRKIRRDSSVSKIDIDDIPNESVTTLEKVKQLCEEGKSNTVEYISEVQKLFKLFDKYGTVFGNVKQSGAKNKAEYETWLRRSISEASNGKFDNDWFVDNLINEQFYSASGTHRTLSDIISELFGDINYHSNKFDVKNYKKILDYYENNKERIHSQKSDYLSNNYVVVSFEEEIARINEDTNAINANTEAKKENAQAGQVITNTDNGMTPVSNESTSSAISTEVQAASEAATAEVAAFKTIDGAVTGLTGDINTKTEAIRAEAQVMIEASKQETQAVGRIVSGVVKLKEEIAKIPKIAITGKNTKSEPIKITAEISEDQINKIRQSVNDAFGEKNPIPIFFKPNVQSIKKQINDGLKDGLEKLTIQSFDFENAAKNMKETLAKAMSDVGLQFNTKKLRLDIKTAVNAARDAAESAGRGNPTLTTSGGKNSKGSNIDPKKLDRLYASFEKEVAAYYHKNTLILRDEDVDSMFSSIMRDIKKQSKSKENLDVLYRRFSEAQIAAINKGLDFNADKSDIGTAVINKGYETLISQINKYLETNTKIIGSQFEEEFSKLLSEASKPAQARTDVDLKQLGAEFARLKNYVDEAGLSGNADNEAKKVSKLDRGYATLALDMKKFHEENNKLDKSTEWADKFNKLFNNITGSISRSEVELEDFRAQFANFKNEIPRDLLGSTVTSEFFENLKGYDIDSIAKIFEKQSEQVKSRLLNDKYGFESPKMTRDISQMLDAQADRLSGLINQENVSDNDIDGIVQHNKQMNNLIDTYQTYSEKRRELQELVSKDSSNEELKRLLQESDALSNSQVYDVQAMKSWSDSYVEAVNNLKTAQSNSEKEQRSSRATSTQQNQYRALTKDIEEATATAQRFKEQYAGLLSDGLNNELNKVIGDMSARSSISVDLSNSSEITTWNDESKKLLDTWTAIQERIKSSVVASGQAGEVITATMDYSQYTRKATNALSNLNSKYKDKLTDKQSAEFEQRLEAIRNKVKEISDDTSKYTANNVQVIETDIQQLEKLAKDFEVVQNSENKINSLIRTLSNSRNSIERRGSTAQPVVNSIDSEKAALEELKRQGQNLDIGNPESVRAFVEKLNEADTTVNKLKNDAEQIRISTNTTASVAKLDSKFNDLLFKVDKFRRDNSKITSDKGISAQFDSLLRSIQTIEKSDVNFQKLNAQFNQLKATVQGKGLTGRSLGDELKYIAEKIGIKAMLGNSIYRVIGAFRQMIGIVTELDTGMTTLRRVTEETEATYRKFLKTAGDEAHELGSTVSGLVDSTGDFARLGYNIQEANALAKNAVMYSNVGWLDIQTATADMTSTMKAFNIEASDSIRIVDTFDILGKKLPLVTISVKGWRHSRPSKDIVNHNICVTTAGGVW